MTGLPIRVGEQRHQQPANAHNDQRSPQTDLEAELYHRNQNQESPDVEGLPINGPIKNEDEEAKRSGEPCWNPTMRTTDQPLSSVGKINSPISPIVTPQTK